ALETVALFYNTELSPEAPSSFTEMKSLCADLGSAAGDETTTTTTVAPATDGFSCVAAVPGDPLTTLPFVTAPGGYLYGTNDDGTPNTSDVGLDNEGALEGAEFLRGLVADAVIEPAEDVTVLAAALAAGETVFALGGLELEEALEAAGAPFEIGPLPFMAGNPPQPFVEVFGFMIAGRSNQPESTALFLSDYLIAGPVMDAVAVSVGKNSAFIGTTETPPATGFLASARDGIPTPPTIDIEVSLEIVARELALLYGLEAEVGAILTAAAEPLRSLSAE
ncbi:MAG: hypothetical protein OEM94_11420, partial [Acidimicrobiia bacterium]|nr:hypothetical protein [Acidimicrobiia bacterium]